MAHARDYGMDLTILARNFMLTPSQRLDNGEQAREFVLELARNRPRRRR